MKVEIKNKTEAKRNIENLQFQLLNWKRIVSAIWRSSPDFRSTDGRVKSKIVSGLDQKLKVVEQRLKYLCQIVGYWSIGRKAMINIGKVLLQAMSGDTDNGLEIICPVCISYKELEDDSVDVPLMVLQHASFVDRIKEVVPVASVTFLFPTHEKTKSVDVIMSMYQRTQKKLAESGYRVVEMSEYAPNIDREEDRSRQEVLEDHNRFKFLIDMVERERSNYYAERGVCGEERRQKIISLVAEFLALGRLAVSRGVLICCITTGRIRCLTHTGAGVLNNPVGFIM